MTKAERIQRKLANADQLTREAYKLAGEIDGVLAMDLARAVDAAGRARDDFARYLNRERLHAEGRAREAADLEEYGACTRCNTGVSAAHLHCEECGWSLDTFGPRAGQCHNGDCGLEGAQQVGVRYSDKAEVA
jgi:hypothetical protein